MKRNKALSFKGRRHIPMPTGRYTVGCADIGTSDFKTGVLIRLFYPSEHSDIHKHYLQWPQWIPDKKYIRGMAIKYGLWPLLLRIFHSFLIGDVYIPAIWQGLISQDQEKFPVIVFSHGLSGWRTAYSTICLELASHGFFIAAVEHRDHSACATFYMKECRMSSYGPFPGIFLHELDNILKNDNKCDWKNIADEKWKPDPLSQAIGPLSYTKEWIYYQTVTEEMEKIFRNQQLKNRASECTDALDLLEKLNAGTLSSNVCDPNFNMDYFRGRLDLSRPVIIGHSFGGATTVQSLITDLRFEIGIALDPWMYPFLNQKELFPPIHQPLLCISTNSFHDKLSMQVLKQLSENVTDGVFLSVIKSHHLDQTDIPFIWKSSVPLLSCSNLNDLRFIVMDLSTQLMVQFLGKTLGVAVPDHSLEFLLLKMKYLKDTFI